MNVAKRFLILDRTNNAMRPCDAGYHGEGQQGDKSPSFLDRGAAEKFGNFLAKNSVGSRYYLVEVLGGVVEYTEPEGTPPTWTPAAGAAD